jgi:membrane protein YqaA with SNARE-associated domain
MDFTQFFNRYGLAVILLLIFAGTIYFSFQAAASTSTATWENTKELLQIVLPIETGLLGSVVGYFFGKGRDQE